LVAINDRTRPVPHGHLLLPLLRRLEGLGLPPEAITLLIATGVHPTMPPTEFTRVVPADALARYSVLCHGADDAANLVHLDETLRSTPIWINRRFLEADLRLVGGNVEPHQVRGLSGPVKSAAIGLARRETVDRNHAHMIDPAPSAVPLRISDAISWANHDQAALGDQLPQSLQAIYPRQPGSVETVPSSSTITHKPSLAPACPQRVTVPYLLFGNWPKL